ncbi:MAG: FHA domain-containing protein [Acidobacteria bacterium]|nr:FHA domain-containing protein [Acidobacteriota bacterium]
MPALFLSILKLIFLALVYLFIWQIARSIGAHVGPGQRSRKTKAADELTVIRSETMAGQTIRIGAGIVIGRSDEADLVIDDTYASEFHVRIGQHQNKVLLTDLGSTNGTYVNGRRVTVPTSLRKGDTVQIGKTIFEVR